MKLCDYTVFVHTYAHTLNFYFILELCCCLHCSRGEYLSASLYQLWEGEGGHAHLSALWSEPQPVDTVWSCSFSQTAVRGRDLVVARVTERKRIFYAQYLTRATNKPDGLLALWYVRVIFQWRALAHRPNLLKHICFISYHLYNRVQGKGPEWRKTGPKNNWCFLGLCYDTKTE